MDYKFKDEEKVMESIRGRLELGYRQYGQLDLALDSRDLLKEAIEEAADMSVYLHSKLVQISMYEKIVEEDEAEEYFDVNQTLAAIARRKE